MVAVMLIGIVLIAGLCVLAYTLAVYALPFMLGVTATQFAYHTGAGFIGAGLVGFAAAVAAFGLLALLFDTLRSPIRRLIVALVFAAPAAISGYALVHGVTKEAVPSEIWRTIFCMIGGHSSASRRWHGSQLRLITVNRERLTHSDVVGRHVAARE